MRGGVVRRRLLPPPAGSTVYELTDYGCELEEILLALGRCGLRSLAPRRSDQALRSRWLGVALLAFVHSEASRGVRETYEFRLDDGVFHARVADGDVRVADGHADRPDLVVDTENESLIALLARVIEPADALASGTLRLSGDETRLGRVLEIFEFPQRDAAAG